MTEQQISNVLEQCNTLTDLITKATELKNNSECDQQIVNRVLSRVRKELVKRTKDVNRIHRITLPSPNAEQSSTTFFTVVDLSSGIVEINGSEVII